MDICHNSNIEEKKVKIAIRIPAQDIAKVRLVSSLPFYRLIGIKDAQGNWVEFQIDDYSMAHFEYIK